MTGYLYLYQVACICLSGSQDFIHLHCDHQEMPGKCFNLPTFIQKCQNTKSGNPEQIFRLFLAWPLLWVCRALSLFFCSEALWHRHQTAAYIAEILCWSISPKQHMIVKYLFHIVYTYTVRNTSQCSRARHHIPS